MRIKSLKYRHHIQNSVFVNEDLHRRKAYQERQVQSESLNENAESSGDIPRLGHHTKLLRVLPDWSKTG
jgi:hypothetical protein